MPEGSIGRSAASRSLEALRLAGRSRGRRGWEDRGTPKASAIADTLDTKVDSPRLRSPSLNRFRSLSEASPDANPGSILDPVRIPDEVWMKRGEGQQETRSHRKPQGGREVTVERPEKRGSSRESRIRWPPNPRGRGGFRSRESVKHQPLRVGDASRSP